MGFQLVEEVAWGSTVVLLVFDAERAIHLSAIGLEAGDDPSVVLRNGQRIIATMKSVPAYTTISSAAPRAFRLLSSRIPSAPSAARGVRGAIRAATLPSSLIKHATLPANRVFHRFSAFNPDHRVDPVTGNFLAGTYATPESEVPFVPTGFAAVARFALPNNLPASHHYEIKAPVGATVDFGSVAPAFGQAGGGVEAYFHSAVINAAVRPTPPSRLPDE